MSLKSILDKRCPNTLLTASDLPEGTRFTSFVAAGFEESPQDFHSPVIFTFSEPVYGKTAWAANKSNVKTIIKLFGSNEQDLIGKTIKLEVISVRNPQTGAIVPSLAVSLNQ
jgi:hypothetical protein